MIEVNADSLFAAVNADKERSLETLPSNPDAVITACDDHWAIIVKALKRARHRLMQDADLFQALQSALDSVRVLKGRAEDEAEVSDIGPAPAAAVVNLHAGLTTFRAEIDGKMTQCVLAKDIGVGGVVGNGIAVRPVGESFKLSIIFPSRVVPEDRRAVYDYIQRSRSVEKLAWESDLDEGA